MAPVAAAVPDSRVAEVLPAALDRLQRTVLARVDSYDEARRQALDESRVEFDEARSAHLAALRPLIDEGILSGLDAQVTAHGQLGSQLVRSADARRRLLARRFNQAAVLAREVARLTGLGYEPLLLERTRATASQVGLSRGQRQRNVAGAFAVPPRLEARAKGRKILLIDDVITTGSTVGACARVLRRVGAARVDVLALALVTDRALIPS